MRETGSTPRLTVIGSPPDAAQVAREVGTFGIGRLVIIGRTPGEGAELAAGTAGAAQPGRDLVDVEGSDVVILSGYSPGSGPALEEIAARIARGAPEAVVIVACCRSTAAARAFLRASRLPPRQVIAAGGLAGERAWVAAAATRLGLDRTQISALVIGDEAPALRLLPRYAVLSGIPLRTLPAAASGAAPELPAISEIAPVESWAAATGRAEAAALIADAVLRDRRRILSCGVHVEGAYGLPTCFVTHPAVIGARGVEEIFPVSLTLEERSFLQQIAAVIEGAETSR